MRLPSFEYLEPKTIREACKLLAKYGPEARVLAGGTDLLPKMKSKEITPRYLIALKSIEGLDYIDYQPGKGLRIGALATLESVRNSPVVKERCPVLGETASLMASTQVRNLATVAGNICNAVPSADMAPPLMVLGAKLRVSSPGKGRLAPIQDFFQGPGQTALGAGEIVTEIVVPNPLPKSGSVYLKHTVRQAMDLALLGAATMVALDGKGACKDVRIALATAAPTPIRALRAEEVLRGKVIDDALLAEASAAAVEEARPRSSVRASESYRRKLVGVLVSRGIAQAMSRARAAGR
ncbi:MAG: FAD binding domain-containing protein [Chloroflexi bacterium]|nr:FAD binding domain-containing protein [Chloroflexota bacterium]